MNVNENSVLYGALFALLRAAVRKEPVEDSVSERFLGGEPLGLAELVALAKRYDVAPMLATALIENGLISADNAGAGAEIARAVLRCEEQKRELGAVSAVFENVGIPFIALKGAVLRGYYSEAWLRTSCDIDILVHPENLDRAVLCLTESLGYTKKGRTAHDVSLLSECGVNVELHFDLVEEGRANNAIEILKSVWESTTLCAGCGYQYQMSDAFFYFYHIAHMAKHFENGGCGIRPFVDLWLLDNVEGADFAARRELLERGGLLKFADSTRQLCRVWFDGEPSDDVSLAMQEFIFSGGIYGSTDNRVAIKKSKSGGRLGYLFSRVFVPYERLKRYYPVLEKHRWLMPVMQVRRWFMLLRPDVIEMAKRELSANADIDKARADKLGSFFENIGLK